MAVYDFKKQFSNLYAPPREPVLVEVPEILFLMADGTGDPRSEAYQNAVSALYSVSYYIRMLPKKGIVPDGYFEYVVAPLEGLWGLSDGSAFDFSCRDNWVWTAMIRQPDFVSEDLMKYAVTEAARKKPNPALQSLRLQRYSEGLCVQCMHIGPFSTEPGTVARMNQFSRINGLRTDLSEERMHHEIYLSDPNKAAPDTMKTILRHPVANA